MSTNSLDELRGAQPDPAQVRARLEELDRNLAGQRFAGRSRDGAVQAISDGQGCIVDLQIDDRVLHRGHPELIGAAIVEAITASRRQATEASRSQVQQMCAIEVEPAPPARGVARSQPETPPRSRRPRRPQPADLDDEEPLFQGLDHERGGLR